ncbi:MAG: alpha/beta hydrolase [Moorea sp. SIO3C2]|nr:alpha/beta hydrolase [Moorena sp. SIO3C2]
MSKLLITDYRLPITDYQLPITNYQLPITLKSSTIWQALICH